MKLAMVCIGLAMCVAWGAAMAAAPGSPERSVAAKSEYQIIIDSSEMPELNEWIEAKLRPTCVKWYPIIVKMLPSEGYTAPKSFTITFKKEGKGVAATGGSRITCAGPWFKKNLEGEAVGA